MKTGYLFLFVCMGLCVRGLPINDKEILSSSCIEMTPEREQEIHKIVEEVNGFIETLSDRHEDIDFTLVKLKIEKHSDDEQDEKETVLKIVINDCKNADTKASTASSLENNFFAEDNSNLAEETSSEEKSEYSDTKSVVENNLTDSEKNSECLKECGNNLLVSKKRSKTNENARSVENNKQTQSKPREEKEEKSGEESSIGEINNNNESIDKTTRKPLQDDEIENLIKDLEDLNDNQRLSDSDNGVYIFAPTIDNSKVELNNHYDELFKDLYKSAIQKLASLETELEKIKQAKTDNRLSNFKDFFNHFERNGINPYYGFGTNLFDSYFNGIRSNSFYGNTGLQLIYF